MGGNMPNIAIYQNPVDPSRPSSCTCSCGDFSYGPPVQCFHPQTCVAYCMQMYRGQCTLINTYGCCGSACEYFQSTSLENRYCTCSCAGQQYYNPVDTCTSSQSCLTRCIANFPQACIPVATQACCGQDCLSYSQAVGNACACRCKGNTYYPSPQCISGEGCVATCMTVNSNKKSSCSQQRNSLSVQTYGDCTFDQTQGCCGAGCATYIPTCACNCGRDFRTITSVPCGSSQSCIDTCISSYGACTQDNTQACCGNDCINAFPSCTCMCGMNQYTTLPMSCGSALQCVQACLQTVAQCTVSNVYSCCGSDCSGFLPTCRCQCGSSVYFATTMCGNAEQCTNACILQYGYVCTPKNTIGCCNGTICTTRNRFVGVSETSTIQLSSSVIVFAVSYFLLFV